MDEIMVVSDMGEQWSPKIPPPRVAATISVSSTPCILAMGIEMASMMAKVPQDVPVEKAIKELITKTTAGKNCGESHSLDQLATYSPVPSWLQASPIAKASNISRAKGISSLIPFKMSSTISFNFMMPCTR